MANAEYLLDTNVLIYATLAADPRHEVAHRLLLPAMPADKTTVHVSVQNLAEMWPALTGPKQDPPDDPSVARAKIESIAALPHVTVLPVDRETVGLTLRLCEQYHISRQRYFDMQIAAVMLQHGIRLLYTENNADFADVEGIEALNPFL